MASERYSPRHPHKHFPAREHGGLDYNMFLIDRARQEARERAHQPVNARRNFGCRGRLR